MWRAESGEDGEGAPHATGESKAGSNSLFFFFTMVVLNTALLPSH